MRYTQNAVNILTVKTYKGIGRAWVVKNLRGNETVEQMVSILNKKSKQDKQISVDDFEYNKSLVLSRISCLEGFCDGLVALGDYNFPKYRGDVKDSEQPIYLFYKGDINLLDAESHNITVIGLLTPDTTIEVREQKIVAEIVKRGVVVVSGLALGCDSIAHMQALGGGKTVAILPSPLNNILPARNKNLAFKIVEEGGLLISEYYDEFKSAMELSSRYKERDRLQAMFCDAIILAASYAPNSASLWKIEDQKLDSGARLAMGYAKDYGIPRAVMHDPIIDVNNPMFDLNRQLIAEQKGIIILTPKTLEELINRVKAQKEINNLSTDYKRDLFS